MGTNAAVWALRGTCNINLDVVQAHYVCHCVQHLLTNRARLTPVRLPQHANSVPMCPWYRHIGRVCSPRGRAHV